MENKLVAQVIFANAQSLDITGPIEVFAQANKFLMHSGKTDKPVYNLVLVAPDREAITTSSGIRILPDESLESFAEAGHSIDTLIISGGNGVEGILLKRKLIDFVRIQAPKARRVASICTGVFVLAQTGLLDGKRATTHWDSCRKLKDEYPKITVEPDMIYIRDRNIYSSAGVTAGIDLALALVEEDFGRELSLTIAKQLVVFMKRQGGQSQFSAELVRQYVVHPVLQDTLDWIQQNLTQDLSIELLASRCAMSERNFSRIFKKETAMTPGKYVEKVRVEVAAQLIETTSYGFGQIADKCGFKNEEMLRRAFKRQLNVLPNVYKKRFGK